MPSQKEMQLLNMFVNQMQGIGQQRQQRSMGRAEMQMNKARMEQERELALKQLDQEAAALKSLNALRKAQIGMWETDQKMAELEVAAFAWVGAQGPSATAPTQPAPTGGRGAIDRTTPQAGLDAIAQTAGFTPQDGGAGITRPTPQMGGAARGGGVPTLDELGARVAGIQDPAIRAAVTKTLGVGAFTEEPKEISMADFQLYATLGPDKLPPHMEPYRESIAREHEYMLESREPKYMEQAAEAFEYGKMLAFTEGVPGVPESLKGFADFEQFFEGGKSYGKMTSRMGGGGVGGGTLPTETGDVEEPFDWSVYTSGLIDTYGLQDDALEGATAAQLEEKKRGLLQERTQAIKTQAPDSVVKFLDNYLGLIDRFAALRAQAATGGRGLDLKGV